MSEYRGWRISYEPSRPITGQWRAVRHGVGMCHNSEEAIKRMIDQKVLDARADAEKRGKI